MNLFLSTILLNCNESTKYISNKNLIQKNINVNIIKDQIYANEIINDGQKRIKITNFQDFIKYSKDIKTAMIVISLILWIFSSLIILTNKDLISDFMFIILKIILILLTITMIYIVDQVISVNIYNENIRYKLIMYCIYELRLVIIGNIIFSILFNLIDKYINIKGMYKLFIRNGISLFLLILNIYIISRNKNYLLLYNLDNKYFFYGLGILSIYLLYLSTTFIQSKFLPMLIAPEITLLSSDTLNQLSINHFQKSK